MPASAPSGHEPLGRSQRFQPGHLRLDPPKYRTEAAHSPVEVYAVPRMRARDEPAITIHLAVALRVRATCLPEGSNICERHGFVAEHNDLFIDLKPWYLALLKENVTRLPLLRDVENAVDVLLHGSGGVRRKRSS